MANEIVMRGTGVMVDRLLKLPRQLRQKPGRRALGKAAAVIKKAAQENAKRVDDPETGRKISQNIGQRFRSRESKRTGNIIISVGVLSERGRIPSGNPDTGPRGNTPHFHLLEQGTEHMRPQPFLRPALADNVDAATAAFAVELEKEMNRIVQEGNKR